jgi:predicted dienelactone hydrolase
MFMKLALKIVASLLGVLFLIAVSLAGYVYATALKPSKPVGFQRVVIADAGHTPISAGIWYPTSAKGGFALLGLTGERVASDGPVLGTGLPLIVISHGTGASSFSHADTALALAANGFVVIAPMHTGDNFQDDNDVGKPDWLVNRSRHVERAINMALQSWKDRGHIDPAKIGIFGFSAGATTALINVGGIPDLTRLAMQCAAHPEFVCKLTNAAAFRNLTQLAWTSDPRISAAVIAAPGLGFTFQPNGLSNVHAAVQLWSGSADQAVPYSTNAGMVARLLPRRPDEHVVSGAVHYSFLMPCGLIGPPQLCRDPKGFDRTSFHRSFNDAVVKFFRTKLAGVAQAAH